MQPLQKMSIFIGFLYNILGSFLVFFLLSVMGAIIAGTMGADILSTLENSTAGFVSLFITSAFIVLGGFASSTRAKYRHLAHGGWQGGVTVIFFIIIGVPGIAASLILDHQIEHRVIIEFLYTMIASIPLGILGGSLGRMFDERKVSQSLTV